MTEPRKPSAEEGLLTRLHELATQMIYISADRLPFDAAFREGLDAAAALAEEMADERFTITAKARSTYDSSLAKEAGGASLALRDFASRLRKVARG